MSSIANFSEARAFLEKAVLDGEIPGVIAVAGASDKRHVVTASGVRKLAGGSITPDTYFDLASLTKVVSTLPAILRLVSEGELKFDDTIGKFFSNAGWFQTPSLAEVRVRQLLSHTSGLPAWKPLFAQLSERRTAVGNILQTGLEHPMGTSVYSDLGFMLLGILVERISGLRQDAFVNEYIFEPLEMTQTRYGPIENVPVAATEDCGWRNELLEGVVHDENAFLMEGIAGHAGLFGTADNLATYAQAWLNLDSRLGKEEVLLEALQEHINDGKVRRGLGWQLSSEGSSAGELASERAYGHTGFTGTSLWLEPEHNWFGVLLTNRVHPTRARGQEIYSLRQAFHKTIAKARTNPVTLPIPDAN